MSCAGMVLSLTWADSQGPGTFNVIQVTTCRMFKHLLLVYGESTASSARGLAGLT